MKTRRPESDWEIMQADDDIVRPKRNYVTSPTHPAVEQESEVEDDNSRA